MFYKKINLTFFDRSEMVVSHVLFVLLF